MRMRTVAMMVVMCLVVSLVSPLAYAGKNDLRDVGRLFRDLGRGVKDVFKGTADLKKAQADYLKAVGEVQVKMEKESTKKQNSTDKLLGTKRDSDQVFYGEVVNTTPSGNGYPVTPPINNNSTVYYDSSTGQWTDPHGDPLSQEEVRTRGLK